MSEAVAGSPPVGRRRVAADVAIQLAGRVLNLALGVVVTLAIVRLLGDRSFGQWSTIFAITQIAGYFADLGLEQVTVRRAAAERDREADWLGALVTLRLTIALPVTAACAAVILLVSTSHDMRVAGLLATAIIPLGAGGVLRTIFQLRTRNDVNTAILTVNSVLWAAAVITIAATDGGMVALAAAFLAVAVITNVLQAAAGIRRAAVHLRGARRYWGPLLRTGITVGATGLVTIAYVRIDQILVFELAGARDAGLYGAVYRVLDQAQFIPISLMTTLFPILAAAHPANPARVRRLFELAADYLAIGSLPLLAFTLAAAGPVVRLLFGTEFADAAPALPILMGTFVLTCFGYLSGNMIVVLGLQRKMVGYALVGLVLNVAANVVLIPPYGFLAAAWITLATQVVVLVLATRAVLRELELRPRVGRIVRAAAAAGGMALVVWALRGAGAPLGALLAAGAGAYGGLVYLLRAVDRDELVGLIRREAT